MEVLFLFARPHGDDLVRDLALDIARLSIGSVSTVNAQPQCHCAKQ
jgi:hypothetical protein